MYSRGWGVEVIYV